MDPIDNWQSRVSPRSENMRWVSASNNNEWKCGDLLMQNSPLPFITLVFQMYE
jgi:hypothetical protein